jgi:RNA polymerase sigma factor (sigma-70 family)
LISVTLEIRPAMAQNVAGFLSGATFPGVDGLLSMDQWERTLDDERSLVEEILAGNTQAFERLIRRYEALVVHVVYRMIVSVQDREDICQDIFIKTYRSLAGFRFESRLSTWIAKVAYNTCINHLAKKRESLAGQCLPGIESLDDLPGDAAAPDRVTEQRDIARRLQAEIEKLPAAHRAILTLFHIDGMTYDEIRKVTGLPEGTVKSHLYRARMHLKARLESKYMKEDLWS